MPSITCRCGELLRYGQIPCPHEWLLISDKEFDRFSGPIEAEQLYQTMTSFMKCPRCGTLWIFWNGFSEIPQEYIPYSLPSSQVLCSTEAKL